jgi:hypothetical protein
MLFIYRSLFNDAFSVTQIVYLGMIGWKVNDDFKSMCMEAVVA